MNNTKIQKRLAANFSVLSPLICIGMLLNLFAGPRRIFAGIRCTDKSYGVRSSDTRFPHSLCFELAVCSHSKSCGGSPFHNWAN